MASIITGPGIVTPPLVHPTRTLRPLIRRYRVLPRVIRRPSQQKAETAKSVPQSTGRVPRVFLSEELVDRATVEAAIDEIIARTQAVCNPLRPTDLQLPHGPTWVGCAGKESRIMTKHDLIDCALAESTIAAHIATHTSLNTPIIPIVFFNLDPSTATSLDIQPPTTEEILATKLANLDKIQPFNFKKLPLEIRQMIYPLCNNLAMQHDGQAPSLVLALARDQLLGSEVVDLYKKINCSVTMKNHDEFGKKKLAELLIYNNIYLQWGAKRDGDMGMEFCTLQAHKVQIMNNFRSLTMDFKTLEPTNLSHLQQVARASSGVSRIAVRLHGVAKSPDNLHTTDALLGCHRSEEFLKSRKYLIRQANEWIHAEGRLARISPADADEEWFWEAPNDRFLPIEHPGRKKVAKATLGNLTLDDRVAGRSRFLNQ